MEIVADLHLHSKYSRAVSRQMEIPTMARWAMRKGIDLLGTGDFTHPLWFRELEVNLEEFGEGIYQKKGDKRGVKFLLTTEVSCVYNHMGKVRRVHVIICLPDLNHARKFNQELSNLGVNLLSDGRPVMGLSLVTVAKIALEITPMALIIPAHVWTPWFGFYGANGGYDSLEEAYGPMARQIPAIETGMSSDPVMNWRIKELDGRRIVSFGDAHSPGNLGREETVFGVTELTFGTIRQAIWGEGKEKIDYTVEFYPEEGKYHFTGHRKCGISQSPEETRRKGKTCPVCGKLLTVGVMHRVEELAERKIQPKEEMDKLGVKWYRHPTEEKPGYVKLVPLDEVLAEVYNIGASSLKVQQAFDNLVEKCGSELAVLLRTPINKIEEMCGERVGEAIRKVRSGEIMVEPGYDGVFGTVKVWPEGERTDDERPDQQVLF